MVSLEFIASRQPHQLLYPSLTGRQITCRALKGLVQPSEPAHFWRIVKCKTPI